MAIIYCTMAILVTIAVVVSYTNFVYQDNPASMWRLWDNIIQRLAPGPVLSSEFCCSVGWSQRSLWWRSGWLAELVFGRFTSLEMLDVCGKPREFVFVYITITDGSRHCAWVKRLEIQQAWPDSVYNEKQSGRTRLCSSVHSSVQHWENLVDLSNLNFI